MSTLAILQLTNREDRKVAFAVAGQLGAVGRAVDAMVQAIRRGGRVFYIGAGTSGRQAILDAAECPPTFGVSPQTIQALIAGGPRALTRAVEREEDSPGNGARDLRPKKITPNDVVIGLAASGTTPYVLGAIRYAQRRKATTVGVTSNPKSPLARMAKIAIVVKVGPEVLTGSSRMKAGTAQKMVLNMLSTTAMVRLGHVYDNWMIDVALINRKLKERGLRILAEAGGRGISVASNALRLSGHNLRLALVMLKRGVPRREAHVLLRDAGGDLREALGE